MTRKILELEQLRGKIFYSKDLAAYPLVKWPRATYQNQLAGKRSQWGTSEKIALFPIRESDTS
jgi:hypothetical protein